MVTITFDECLAGLTRRGVSQVVDQGPKVKGGPFLLQQKEYYERNLNCQTIITNNWNFSINHYFSLIF